MSNATSEEVQLRTRQGSGRPFRYVALVVAATALLQAMWIAVVPPFRGVDEFDHAYRAAGVAAGQWIATEPATNGRGLLVEVPGSLVAAAHEQCVSLAYTGPDNCSAVEVRSDDTVVVATGAGGYNPVYYWVIGTVAQPFSGAAALYVMRAMSAVLCLSFVGLAAWAVAKCPAVKWSRVGLLIAMPPVMLYSMSIAAPNGIEMAASLAMWCSLLALGEPLERRTEQQLILIAAVSAIVLMLGRQLGPLFALLILLTVWALHPSLVRRVAVSHTRLFSTLSALVLVASAWAIAWFEIHKLYPPLSEGRNGEWSWRVPVQWVFQSVASFPLRNQPAPSIVYPVVFVAFAALVCAALRSGGTRQRVVLALSLVMSALLPAVLTLLTYEGRGTIWQGRYGLPYAIGCVLIAAGIIDRHRWMSRFPPGLLVAGAAAMAVATAACWLRIVEDEKSRAPSVLDSAWLSPPVAVLLLGAVASWTLFYLACARSSHD